MLPKTAENSDPIHIAGAAGAASWPVEPRRFFGFKLPLAWANTIRSLGVTTRVIDASSPMASSAKVLWVRIAPSPIPKISAFLFAEVLARRHMPSCDRNGVADQGQSTCAASNEHVMSLTGFGEPAPRK
jgi:hypothetical protein